jgi:hypothetical protein
MRCRYRSPQSDSSMRCCGFIRPQASSRRINQKLLAPTPLGRVREFGALRAVSGPAEAALTEHRPRRCQQCRRNRSFLWFQARWPIDRNVFKTVSAVRDRHRQPSLQSRHLAPLSMPPDPQIRKSVRSYVLEWGRLGHLVDTQKRAQSAVARHSAV